VAKEAKKSSTVPLNWKAVHYTNCPLVSASNIDQELGWTRVDSMEGEAVKNTGRGVT
jgi:hypothetical protein